MKISTIFLLCAFSCLTLPAQSQQRAYSDLQAVAKPTTYSYLFWDVYSAQLFAPNAVYEQEKPLALKLVYQIELKGKAIAERSVAEMKEQGLDDPEKERYWYQQLADIIPDVKKGDEIIGQVDESGKTTFFFNQNPVGEIDDMEFSKRFFDIWLGVKTSEPKLRLALIGKGR